MLRYRLWLIAVAPLEIVGLALTQAWKGAVMGAENIAEAWRAGPRCPTCGGYCGQCGTQSHNLNSGKK